MTDGTLLILKEKEITGTIIGIFVGFFKGSFAEATAKKTLLQQRNLYFEVLVAGAIAFGP